MTGRNHLGSTSEMLEFITNMNDELIKHKKQKSSMRDWSFNQSMFHCIQEIKDRTKQIKTLHRKLVPFRITYSHGLHSLDDHKKPNRLEMNKQFIHIGNFAMMGYVKSK